MDWLLFVGIFLYFGTTGCLAVALIRAIALAVLEHKRIDEEDEQ